MSMSYKRIDCKNKNLFPQKYSNSFKNNFTSNPVS